MISRAISTVNTISTTNSKIERNLKPNAFHFSNYVGMSPSR
jgi:hypothetical protein